MSDPELLARLDSLMGAVERAAADMRQASMEFKEDYTEAGNICLAVASSVLKGVIEELNEMLKTKGA